MTVLKSLQFAWEPRIWNRSYGHLAIHTAHSHAVFIKVRSSAFLKCVTSMCRGPWRDCLFTPDGLWSLALIVIMQGPHIFGLHFRYQRALFAICPSNISLLWHTEVRTTLQIVSVPNFTSFILTTPAWGPKLTNSFLSRFRSNTNLPLTHHLLHRSLHTFLCRRPLLYVAVLPPDENPDNSKLLQMCTSLIFQKHANFSWIAPNKGTPMISNYIS